MSGAAFGPGLKQQDRFTFLSIKVITLRKRKEAAAILLTNRTLLGYSFLFILLDFTAALMSCNVKKLSDPSAPYDFLLPYDRYDRFDRRDGTKVDLSDRCC